MLGMFNVFISYDGTNLTFQITDIATLQTSL